jgi:hypothetical protein
VTVSMATATCYQFNCTIEKQTNIPVKIILAWKDLIVYVKHIL